MKSKKAIMLYFFISFFFCCCLQPLWAELLRLPWTIKEQEIIADINANLYPGLSREKAEEFFIERNIEYSWLEEDKTFTAMMRGVRKGLFVSEGIHIVGYLNSNQEIISITVQPVYKAP